MEKVHSGEVSDFMRGVRVGDRALISNLYNLLTGGVPLNKVEISTYEAPYDEMLAKIVLACFEKAKANGVAKYE